MSEIHQSHHSCPTCTPCSFSWVASPAYNPPMMASWCAGKQKKPEMHISVLVGLETSM